MADDLFTTRQNLAEIARSRTRSFPSIPEKHVWADSNSSQPQARKPELRLLRSFRSIRSGVPHGHSAKYGSPLEARSKG